MTLGFVSAILSDLDFEELLEFAAAEGFSCVEAMCWPPGKADRKYAGVTHVDAARLSHDEAQEILALCDKYQISLSGLGYYPNPLDPDPTIAKMAVSHLKKVILAAERLGLRTVNTFVGKEPSKTVDENWPRFLRTWKPLLSFAADHGVRIGIENCPMLFTRDEWPGGKNLATSPVIWRRMFHDLDARNLGLNYDPSHLVLQQMDPLAPLEEFQNRIFHVHAKDVKIHWAKVNEVGMFSLPKEWHSPRIPGYGEMDWGRFMAALMETSYRGPVCIEVEDTTFGSHLEGRIAALRVARNVLAPYFPKS